MAGRPEDVKPGATQWALALACALLLAVKFWLIGRININWDEFYFLSQVHAAARGELTQGLQNAYTHLFTWLTWLDGDEIHQIVVARAAMVSLLGISAMLIQRLASRWFPPTAAWTAALVFLAMWPTLKHGGSFRADSLLLPLQLGALVVLTSPRLGDRERGLGAGLLLGCATVVSIKAVLLAPVVAAMGLDGGGNWRRGLQRLAWLGLAASITAGLLFGAHLLSMQEGAAAASNAAAANAWQKTVGDAPWLPQLATLQQQLAQNLIFWVVAGAGLLCALRRRLWAVAAVALALLPIVFYRNSFAYYYVVMWGPACLLIAAAASELGTLAARVASPPYARMAAVAIAVLLTGQGLRQLPLVTQPRQENQRKLVAAVHQIFPTPVPYIDHSGMVASFRKVNFFMSSWGVEGYLARGKPFLPPTLTRHRPPLLITNTPVLFPGLPAFELLLPEDSDIIENQYQHYWGPIRIAGAAATFEGPGAATLQLPFGGRYRLESLVPVNLAGRVLEPEGIIEVGDAQTAVQIEIDGIAATVWPLKVRLLWADAKAPPTEYIDSLDLYDSL